MPIADMTGSTGNAIGASRMQAAVGAQKKSDLIGGIGATAGAVDEEMIKRKFADALARNGLDPALAEDPHAATQALLDKHKETVQQQMQGEAFKQQQAMQQAGFEHSDAAQKSAQDFQAGQRQEPTFGETMDMNARTALGKAYSDPEVDTSAPGVLGGFMEGGVGNFKTRAPTDAEANQRFLGSGYAPVSAIGAVNRGEATDLRRGELDLSKKRLDVTHGDKQEGFDVTRRGQDLSHGDRQEGFDLTKRGQDIGHGDRLAALEETKKENKARNDRFLAEQAYKVPGAVLAKARELNTAMMATYNPEEQKARQKEFDDLIKPYMPEGGAPTQTLGKPDAAPDPTKMTDEEIKAHLAKKGIPTK